MREGFGEGVGAANGAVPHIFYSFVVLVWLQIGALSDLEATILHLHEVLVVINRRVCLVYPRYG